MRRDIDTTVRGFCGILIDDLKGTMQQVNDMKCRGKVTTNQRAVDKVCTIQAREYTTNI